MWTDESEDLIASFVLKDGVGEVEARKLSGLCYDRAKLNIRNKSTSMKEIGSHHEYSGNNSRRETSKT